MYRTNFCLLQKGHPPRNKIYRARKKDLQTFSLFRQFNVEVALTASSRSLTNSSEKAVRKCIFISPSHHFFKLCIAFSASAGTSDPVMNYGTFNAALMVLKTITKEELKEHTIANIAPDIAGGGNHLEQARHGRSFWNISDETSTVMR